MDLRESPVAPQSQLHHHHHHHHHHQQQQPQPQQPPPGMMMVPPLNSYTPNIPNNNGNNNSGMISPNSVATTASMMQNPRFPFDSVMTSASKPSDSVNSQYGEGISPSSGLRATGFSIEPARKKRGRPRKYSPDGNIALAVDSSPVTPISTSTKVHGDSAAGGGGGGNQLSEPSGKRRRGRPPGSGKKQLNALGSPGVGFTPHVITAKAGEDIALKIMAFSQQGPRTVCILSANGAISNVTLRQPSMSGETVTYEGRFEILSLSGSFSLSESNGNRSRTGGLSVSLAGSDCRVVGGEVAGMLIAATPVQVIVGSFVADGKKSKSGPALATHPNMLNFGGPVPEISPPSEGASSESSGDSGSSPLNHGPGPYGNASQPIQNMPMYTNMGWPNPTMNMLPN